MRSILLICIILFCFGSSTSQESKIQPLISKGKGIAKELFSKKIDSNYIQSYDLFTVKPSFQSRFNAIGLNDGRTGNQIRYIPDLGITFGIGGATKSFSFDINTQLGFSQNKINTSNYTDIQFRLFTSQHYLRLRHQYYLGYRLIFDTADGDLRTEEDDVREDLRSLQFGMQYLFVFNHDRFSLKAPFALNERQKKSAGSFVAGFEYVVYTMNADSSIVPQDLELIGGAWNSFQDMSLALFSINVGYMYSVVVKDNFFITSSIIPGVGLKNGDYRQEEREVIDRALFLRINSMNAVGYNGDRFAVGLQFDLGLNHLPLERNLVSIIVDGRASLYFGYRI